MKKPLDIADMFKQIRKAVKQYPKAAHVSMLAPAYVFWETYLHTSLALSVLLVPCWNIAGKWVLPNTVED